MENNQFYARPVSDFLADNEEDKFVFEIPSFQRGYRWRSKQIEDLLDDLYNFAKEENEQRVYYLQPLVVKKGISSNSQQNIWEVLDGQQRLTTLRLILEALKEYVARKHQKKSLYDIKYLIRSDLDFNKPNRNINLDNYFISNAKEDINDWLDNKNSIDDGTLDTLATILFGGNPSKKIMFIWYEVEGNDATEKGSISIFNRLNRGKIKLTPSELIKALLIISAKKVEKGSGNYQTILSMQWNEIERKFLEDDFFAFLNGKNNSFDTRTDLLFNNIVLSRNEKNEDSDFAYRWFQKQFDESRPEDFLFLWHGQGKEHTKDKSTAGFTVKEYFDMLLQWYSDIQMYNLIGYLTVFGENIQEISKKLSEQKEEKIKNKKEWKKGDNIRVLKDKVKSTLPNIKGEGKTTVPFPEALEILDYQTYEHKGYIHKILLLFNVLTYSRQKLRFPFNDYLKEKWDIEHVDSQTENPLAQTSDQDNWIQYSKIILEENAKDEEVAKVLKLVEDYLSKGGNFQEIYKSIINVFQPAQPVPQEKKDSIGNLTLLDAGTNRGYGNALFPFKRKEILKRERKGDFVPACTRNLFLKYYTVEKGEGSSTNNMSWNENDVNSYYDAIKNLITEEIFNDSNAGKVKK